MLRYAILALLREQADYGYRLKQRFDDRTGGAWLLNIGQVYQTLQCLERSGLIAGTRAASPPRPVPRRVVAITPKGIRALERWMRRPTGQPRPVRDELLLRLLASDPAERAALRPHVASQEQLCRARLQRIVELLADPERRGEPVQRLSLEAEMLHMLAQLAWLERCGEVLNPDTASTTRTQLTLPRSPCAGQA